jgi:hypothetical protein
MSIGDIAVGLVAFIALAFLALIVLNKLIALIKNWREIAEVTGWVALILGGGGLLIVGAFFAVVFIGATFYEQYTAKQCLSAHERYARAQAAPNDYWGNKLRDEAAAEAKKCADLAARKETEKFSQK